MRVLPAQGDVPNTSLVCPVVPGCELEKLARAGGQGSGVRWEGLCFLSHRPPLCPASLQGQSFLGTLPSSLPSPSPSAASHNSLLSGSEAPCRGSRIWNSQKFWFLGGT